ncbi:class II 3-deoxy-7-phosphoheptulonate synthase [Simplicispira lacusdiani]|uniref:class II 3-deoxy-7-phosphoheptulonate synthase n=1 Tax=Simplicispira lacusdiani TaxID=2213010 RepID=UPI000E739DEC|nr:3-deoxy-7-phosphoheptulonate synthase class II [Simplicispira lacusdiani]
MLTTTPPPSPSPAWQPDSWRTRPVRQMPAYPDPQALDAACAQLRQFPPLIFAGEVQALRAQLAEVAAGRGFLLQGGDCAESFDTLDGEAARETFRVMLQMAVVLTYAAARPVVKVGRIAGQYAKPRSADTETQGGVTLPSYRGDIVNGAAFTAHDRAPQPERLLRAYSASAATLNLLRALAQGGFADLHQLHGWTADFVRASPQGQRYQELADRISETLGFMAACGFTSDNTPQLREVAFYTSHEALLLPYEEALTRREAPLAGATRPADWFGASAHMLWLGERTRQLDGAHIEYLRGIANPVGVKIGPGASAEDVLALLQALDPAREPGRVVLITRMGAGQLPAKLPPLLAAVKASGHPVVWSCDPMHGNTTTTAQGVKTRDFAKVVQEVREFFAAHAQAGTVAGGLHVELTGQDVTECRGGSQNLTDEHLQTRYTTACDPRLNGSQSLELAFLVADLLKAQRG